MVDFTLPTEIVDLSARVRSFVAEKIVPYESDPRMTAHGPTEDLRSELVALAKADGLLSLQAPQAFGGRGLTHLEQAAIFEAAGWSPLGPTALNFAAPDEGNMLLLNKVANPAQKEQWLRPMAEGRYRSCFSMTEPGGAGADPSLLRTQARRAGDGFLINGRKWLITGAIGARFTIIMADVVPDEEHPAGPTMFLAPMDAEGINICRQMNSIDKSFTGGHAEIEFSDVFVPADSVLGAIGEGFRYAQVRLAPARVTHCMRWLGGACRVNEVAIDFANHRQAFGKIIGEHEGVGFMLADNAIDIETSRLAIWKAAWLLDQGSQARHESSLTKVFVSEALFRIADRCVQILGGQGLTDDTPAAWLFQELRAFRIYDGPSETHRWAMAKRILKGAQAK